MKARRGRPPKPPEEAHSQVISLRLTPEQARILDALVDHCREIPGHSPDTSRGDLLRGLLKARYEQAVTFEAMIPITETEYY